KAVKHERGGPAWSWPSRGSYTKIKLLTPAGEHTGRHSERNKLKISTPGVKPFRGGGPRETIHRAPRRCGNRRAHRPRQDRARARADRDRPGPTDARKAARDHDRPRFRAPRPRGRDRRLRRRPGSREI